MKLVKSLLLGSAAGIAAVAAAQAADLPSRKAAPAEYVKICDAYGAGFFYIPGTDTCLKVGGYVRAEYLYMSPQSAYGIVTPAKGAAGAVWVPSGQQDTTGFLARGRVELDARTQTPWGTARTFMGLRLNTSSGPYAGGDSTVGAAGLAVAYTGKAAGNSATLENAVIQFAGFTFGHTTADIMSFVPPEYYMPMFNYGSPAGFSLLAYTATFGGGLSATIGIEDRASMGWNNPGSPTVIGGGAITTAHGPYTWPVLAGNIRIDQAWGSAQLSGGVIDNNVLINGPAGPAFPSVAFTKDSVGWGITAGLKINLPMMGPGDHIVLNASYGDGFLDVVQSNNSSDIAGDDGRMFGGLLRMDSNVWAHLNAGCAVGSVAPGCYGLGSSTGWSIEGFYNHHWSPTVRSVLMVGYSDITPPASVRNTDWTLGGLSERKIFRVNFQPIVWNPIPGLELGGEISYGHLDQSYAHAPGVAPTAPAAGLPAPSSDSWQGRLRVTRQF